MSSAESIGFVKAVRSVHQQALYGDSAYPTTGAGNTIISTGQSHVVEQRQAAGSPYGEAYPGATIAKALAQLTEINRGFETS